MRSRAVAVALVTLATFTDIVAYSIAIPVLPDIGHRLGASPTTIGLLFGAFGVTLLSVSIPMGAVSDRIGRKAPMVSGLMALALASVLFAFGDRLVWLFAARLVQGAADAVTWVVGFALIADLYGPDERGRVAGIVMSGTTFAVMIGPTLGGWLYEAGGPALPFLAVAALAAAVAAGFVWLDLPVGHAARDSPSMRQVLRTRPIIVCALVVVAASATISMTEPVLALHLGSLGVRPGRIGTVFGAGALVSTVMHPLFGRLTDRLGARRMTLFGLVAVAVTVVALSQSWSFASAIALFCVAAAGAALVITPSLAFMSEAIAGAGIGSFGVAYGIYNMAWGAGLLAGPSAGGFLYERLGFSSLALVWSPVLLLVTALLARVKSVPSPATVT
jgi:MFS transporter, DHA1 family, solute carrier family 18 (vesicular amine transporter), member 1/2